MQKPTALVSGDGGCCRTSPRYPAPSYANFNALPDSDSVSQALQTDDMVELHDGVITNYGGVEFKALQPAGPHGSFSHGQLTDANLLLASRLYEEGQGERLPAGTQFETSVQPYSKACVTQTARIIAREVNDLNNKSNANGAETKAIAGLLNRTLEKLGVDPLTTKVITARCVYSDDPEDPRHLTHTLYYNEQTDKAVSILMTEGHM